VISPNSLRYYFGGCD